MNFVRSPQLIEQHVLSQGGSRLKIEKLGTSLLIY